MTTTVPKTAQKTGVIALDQLKIETYVRVKLSDDRIMHFALLFEGGAEKEIPPIQITPDFSVIDGRHRIEGAILAGKKEIRVEFISVNSKVHQIELALKANLGGALPPSKPDIILVLKEMIEEGAKIKHVTAFVAELYPESVAKKFVQEARHGIYRDKLARAKREVHEGHITIAAAAEKYGVELEALTKELGGKQPHRHARVIAADVKRDLSTQFRSNGAKIGKLLDKAVVGFEEGNMSKEQVVEIFSYYNEYISGVARRLAETEKRFLSRAK